MEQKDILEDSSLNEKVCNTCSKTYRITDFRKCVEKNGRSWYRNKCKYCSNADSRKKYALENPNANTIPDIPDGFKRCGKCKDTKSIDSFNKDKSRKDGFRNNCKTCEAKRSSEYQKANRDKVNLKTKRWRASNPEKSKASAKKYYEANPEYHHKKNAEYYKNNKEKRQTQAKSWREANPEKVKEYRLRYKMNIRRNTPNNFDTSFVDYIKLILSGKCAYCDNQATTIEHIVPLSKGGLNEPQNIVGACVSCNSSKNNKEIPQVMSIDIINFN